MKSSSRWGVQRWQVGRSGYVVLPGDFTTGRRKVPVEGLPNSYGLLGGVVGSHSPCTCKCRDALFFLWERSFCCGVPPLEVMKGHCCFHNGIHICRAHSNHPVVDSPLCSKNPKGILDNSSGSWKAVVEDPLWLGEVSSRIGPQHIPPCNKMRR